VRNRSHNRCRRLVFGLELLESRELLSAVGHSDRPVAEVSVAIPALHEVIAGTYNGSAIVSPTSNFGGTATFITTGTAIGLSSFDGSDSYSVNKRDAVRYTHGTATLANTSGDEISVSFAGKGRESRSGEFADFVKGAVTGGTGTYAGAAGTVSASGTFDGATGSFSANVKIVLKRV
jgi:hypothetical protein